MLEAEKKLKVIWDLLKNTDAVRFRLTVTMYREKGEEPVVVTMEGTRAENGEWNLQPPPSKRTGPLESTAELQEKLRAIEASVQKYISQNSLDEDWRDWVDALKEVMGSGYSTEFLEDRSPIPVRAHFGYGYGAHFFAPLMAIAYVIEGAEALERNELEEASRCVDRGVYWSRDEIFISDPANRFVGRARTGGGGKAEGRSIAIATDEGEVVFKGGLMSRPGLRNKGWDGAKLLVFDRLSTGSIIARQPRITVNLMVQDAVLDVYQQDRGAVARGSGFWARYLVGAPLSTQGFRFINYIDEEWRELPAFHARVKELLDSYTTQRKSGAVKREILEFSPEAAAEWVRLFNHLEGQIQPWQYLNDIHDFASKANEMLARVAAILHHFTKQQGKITKATLDAAVAIVNWHLHEYKRLFSPQFSSYSMQESMMELERFLFINYWKVGLQCVAKNHVLRNGPYHLRSKAALEPVIEALIAQGSINVFKDQGANKFVIGMNHFRFNSLNYY